MNRHILNAIQHEMMPKRILPTFKAEGEMDCSICQDTISIGQEIFIFPCSEIVNHKFHKKCIEPWLKEHNTCPVCRSKLREY